MGSEYLIFKSNISDILDKTPPLLVTGRENGFQNMVTGRENGFQNGLPEQNVDANIGYWNKKRMPILVNRNILTQQ